jgi:hypothetical protein
MYQTSTSPPTPFPCVYPALHTSDRPSTQPAIAFSVTLKHTFEHVLPYKRVTKSIDNGCCCGVVACDGAHIVCRVKKQKKTILIMVLNNEVLLVELVILIPNGAKSNPHWRETNFKPRTQLLISFCHKPKSLETIGGINPKEKKLWDIFLVDKLN